MPLEIKTSDTRKRKLSEDDGEDGTTPLTATSPSKRREFALPLTTPTGRTPTTARYLYSVPANQVPFRLPENAAASPGTAGADMSRGYILSSTTGTGTERRTSLLFVVPRRASAAESAASSPVTGASPGLPIRSARSPSKLWRPF
ncbi:MAG: hypothetical protein SGCHY_005305 [Lobulomycetales sp.]